MGKTKKTMNDETLYLYLIHQSKCKGYDTYDSAVVCARNEEEARHIHPNGYGKDKWWSGDFHHWDCWSHPKYVSVKKLGVVTTDVQESADAPSIGVVTASFNAG